MGQWLAGMSGNLIADLIAVPILYFLGLRYIDGRAARQVVVRMEAVHSVGSRQPIMVGVKLLNLSLEPIQDIRMELEWDRPDNYVDPDPEFRAARVGPTWGLGDLAVGRDVRSETEIVHGTNMSLRVTFRTVRGRTYIRHLYGPRPRPALYSGQSRRFWWVRQMAWKLSRHRLG